MIESIKEIYLKNLDALYNEISLYANESDIWEIKNQISNSAGTLTLHLVGNLNFFIGTYLGNTGYERNRDLEFSARHVAKQKLLYDISETKEMVNKTLSAMNPADDLAIYPTDKFGEGRTTGYVLMYLLAHLNYHLGQVNYHRRLIVQ